MHYNYGVIGVSFSTMVTIFCNMIFVIIYAWKVSVYEISPIPKNIKSLMRKNDLQVYFSISVPSIIMLMAEWIGIEMLIVIAATISISAVGAMSLSYSFFNVLYQFPYGFQLAVTAVVGNNIGEGNEKLGKLGVCIGVMYASVVSSILGYLTYTYAEYITGMYTNDPDMIALLLPLI